MAEKMLTNWFTFLLHKFLKVRLVVWALGEVMLGIASCQAGSKLCLQPLAAGVCGGATFPAVLRHQATDGEGPN